MHLQVDFRALFYRYNLHFHHPHLHHDNDDRIRTTGEQCDSNSGDRDVVARATPLDCARSLHPTVHLHSTVHLHCARAPPFHYVTPLHRARAPPLCMCTGHCAQTTVHRPLLCTGHCTQITTVQGAQTTTVHRPRCTPQLSVRATLYTSTVRTIPILGFDIFHSALSKKGPEEKVETGNRTLELQRQHKYAASTIST